MARRKFKKKTNAFQREFIYWLIILSPWLFLFSLAVSLGLRLKNIAATNPDNVVALVEESRLQKEGRPFSFEVAQGLTGYCMYDKVSQPDIDDNVFIPLDHTPHDYVICVYGGSSLVAPSIEESFPYYLESLLADEYGEKVRVYNFGCPGFSSSDVRNRISGTLAQFTPDLLIVYSGHNDYINTYNDAKPHYFLLVNQSYLNSVLRFSYNFFVIPTLALLNLDGIYHLSEYEIFLSFFLNPRLNQLFQRLTILAIPEEPFEQINKCIFTHFKNNVQSMIDMAVEQRIPILFLTLISNFEAATHTIGGRGEILYEHSMGKLDYQNRINLLRQAKDADVFSGDIRAKSELNNYLRSLAQPGISILDLEQKLIEAEFDFNFKSFTDYVHFCSHTNKKIADTIVQHLNVSGLYPVLKEKNR